MNLFERINFFYKKATEEISGDIIETWRSALIDYFIDIDENLFTTDLIKKWLSKNLSVLKSHPKLLNCNDNNFYYNRFLGKQKSIIMSIEEGDSEQKIIINTNKNSFDDILTKGSFYNAVLLGVGIIPNLYLWIIDYDYLPREILPKESTENYWLIDGLFKLFESDGLSFFDTKTKDLFNKFIKLNLPKINSIRSMFQLANPKLLGQGVDGVVYDIGGNKVLKIFTSDYVYKNLLLAQRLLRDKPHFAKTEAMVYDVGIIGHFDNNTFLQKTIYYAIIEKMHIEDSNYQELIDRAKDYIKFIIDSNEVYDEIKSIKNKGIDNILPKDIDYLTNLVEEQLKYNENFVMTVDKLSKNDKLARGWDKIFIKEIISKYLTSRTDLHSGNVGVTNMGELRYFDPAHEQFTSQIN